MAEASTTLVGTWTPVGWTIWAMVYGVLPIVTQLILGIIVLKLKPASQDAGNILFPISTTDHLLQSGSPAYVTAINLLNANSSGSQVAPTQTIITTTMFFMSVFAYMAQQYTRGLCAHESQ